MEKMMKAARMHRIGEFSVEEVPVPVPHGEELLVRIGACGVCGSDLPRIYTTGTSKQKYPLTLGPGPEAFRVGGKGEDTAAEGESDEKKHADQSQERTKAHCFAPASIAALFLLRGTI